MEELSIKVKQLFVASNNNIEVMSKLLDTCLVPSTIEKKSLAEISTPHELRKEMLDKIPDEFWSRPRTVLEPCSGKGGFLIDIVNRFMKGLVDVCPCSKERYRFIVEKCLYFSDINESNIFINKLLLDPDNEYQLNYNIGDTLKLDPFKKWGLCSFDAVIGNPPYESITETGESKGGGNNNYTKFIYHANDVLGRNGLMLFINPPTYFGPGRNRNKTGTSLRKDILDKYYCHYINLEECSKYFKVGSKFVYYLIQKINDHNKKLKVLCKYRNNVYETVLNQDALNNMNYIPCLLTQKAMSVNLKVKNEPHKLAVFHSPDNRHDKTHVLSKKKNESFEEYRRRANEEGYMHPMQATGTQIVFSSKKCKNQNDKKILMSRSGYLKPFYDPGIIGIGGNCFCVLVSSKEEALYTIKLLNSKLYRFYTSVNKWSGFHNIEVLRDLPCIKIAEITDDKIYEYFELTDEDIKHVEENI